MIKIPIHILRSSFGRENERSKAQSEAVLGEKFIARLFARRSEIC
jgi:hypothetical protein